MKIFVKGYGRHAMKVLTLKCESTDTIAHEKVFTLECESTDTIAHLKVKVQDIERTIPIHHQRLMFDGKQLDDNFSENMTLTDVGVEEGSVLQLCLPSFMRHSAGRYIIHRQLHACL